MTDELTTHPVSAAEPNRFQQEVVILGGGFAGVYCGQRIRKALKKAGLPPEMAVLVSDQNYMVFQPMLAEVAGGSLSPRHVVNPIRRLCRGIQVLRGTVQHIDLAKKEVRINTGNFSSGVIIEFNHIVLGLGAEIDLSRVPGMPEHAFLMQNVGDAMVLRATIISRLEEANAESREDVRKRLLSFVVVGGGYSGVETAGEILDLVHETAKFYRYIDANDLRVVLVHSRSRVLHTLGDELGEYAGTKLKERGLELILEDRVSAVTATKVYLKSGQVIDTATVVSTVGTAPNRIIKQLCDEQNLPHDRYRLKTDSTMQVEGHEGVWAAGDCALIPLADSDGEFCPQTAQFAMREGLCLADNIGAKLIDKQPKPFTFKGLGELASIGHQTAVAEIMGVKFSGFIAWFMWRTIYLAKLPGLDRKLRVMIDWTLDLFFPRDINLLSPRYTSLFREVHLEPDDRLFTRGEPAFSLYVVQQGGIELQDLEGNSVREISEGDFFGERALVHGGGYQYNAVAKGSTKLVSLSGEAVLPFFESSRRFRRVLAKTSARQTVEDEILAIKSKLPESMLSQKVTEVMRRDLATLKGDQTVADALQLFLKRRFNTYPLVSEEGKLVGVLGREDIFDFIKREGVTDSTPLNEVDLMHLPQCDDSSTVADTLDKMTRVGRYKCLITDKEQRLLGILTVMDLLGEAAKG